MPVEISLTRGYTTIVDDEDADLAEFNWHALVTPRSRTVYARRNVYFHPPGQPRISRPVRMHRLILSRILDRSLSDKEEPDHKDGNGLNNKRSNIRIATRGQNKHNILRVYPNKRVPFQGVTFVSSCGHLRKPYRVVIYKDGKSVFLGYFATPEEAFDRYQKASLDMYGEFSPYFDQYSEVA